MPNKNRTLRQRAESRGMTLVEMLTAMGVIAVLIAMLALGIKYVRARAQADRTRTMLQNLRGMYTEFEAKGGRMRMLDQVDELNSSGWLTVQRYAVPTGVVFDDGESITSGTGTGAFIGNRDNSVDDHAAVRRMIVVLKALQTMPANRKVAESWSEDMAAKVRDPADGQKYVTLPTDGWGNPILYAPRKAIPVPANPAVAPAGPPPANDKLVWGLQGLTLHGQSGTYYYQPSDAKGVFFSAGPDGDFSTADDNIYSDDSGKTTTGKLN